MWSLLKHVLQNIELLMSSIHISLLIVSRPKYCSTNRMPLSFSEYVSHVPILATAEEQSNLDLAITPVKRVQKGSQGAIFPAVPTDSLDSECVDLPMCVSLTAGQSKSNIACTQNIIPTEDSAELALTVTENLKEPVEEHSQDKEGCSSEQTYIAIKPCRGEAVLAPSSNYSPLIDPADISDKSPAHHITENTAQLCEATNPSIAIENEITDIAMPLNHSMDDESEDIPPGSIPTACPVMPLLPGDVRKEMTHRGGLVGSKVMKRSSSVISDSGIESEPSSVAWPVEAALRGKPHLDFSSEREIPQQIVLHHPVHRSYLEGLQMDSNGSLPSGGIQASLTSISSLPYEEDQQQRQLSKLTKSVSAPQISSPEDIEEGHTLLNGEADRKSLVGHQDSCRINCSLNSNLDSEQSELSPLDMSSSSNPGHILKENITSEKANSPRYLSETYGIKSVSSSVSEVSLLQESVEIPHVKESAVIGSQRDNLNHQTHMSEVTSVEDVHVVESETVPCSCGNKPSVHESAADQERIITGDDCQSFHQTQLFGAEKHECLDPSQTLIKPSCFNELPSSNSTTKRPSDLLGLANEDTGSSADVNEVSSSEKAPLDCPSKPSKIPNSGLAFVNKKMVEVVNMSVSCAPTCLPFSSVLRDSPSISGMSTRQATSPITHQPLGSFGIISSSSLSPLNMDEETNERMLK